MRIVKDRFLKTRTRLPIRKMVSGTVSWEENVRKMTTAWLYPYVKKVLKNLIKSVTPKSCSGLSCLVCLLKSWLLFPVAFSVDSTTQTNAAAEVGLFITGCDREDIILDNIKLDKIISRYNNNITCFDNVS